MSQLLILCAVTIAAQDSTTGVVSEFDWTASTLSLTIDTARDTANRNGAAASWEAQRRLEDIFLDRLINRLYDIPVDSRRTVGDFIEQDPSVAAELVDIAADAERGSPYSSPDLSRLHRRYSISVFPDLARLFVYHEVPFQLQEMIEWIPTRPYTGLVIYAAEPLVIRGERDDQGRSERGLLEPALFPEIFDTDFRPILQQDMLYPDWILRWGVVAYTESLDETDWIQRVGLNPMRIMAEEAFGVRPSDIIIDPRDADRLLSYPQNREILRQGRIVVILPSGGTSD